MSTHEPQTQWATVFNRLDGLEAHLDALGTHTDKPTERTNERLDRLEGLLHHHGLDDKGITPVDILIGTLSQDDDKIEGRARELDKRTRQLQQQIVRLEQTVQAMQAAQSPQVPPAPQEPPDWLAACLDDIQQAIPRLACHHPEAETPLQPLNEHRNLGKRVAALEARADAVRGQINEHTDHICRLYGRLGDLEMELNNDTREPQETKADAS